MVAGPVLLSAAPLRAMSAREAARIAGWAISDVFPHGDGRRAFPQFRPLLFGAAFVVRAGRSPAEFGPSRKIQTIVNCVCANASVFA
jgi:hypothetical protein